MSYNAVELIETKRDGGVLSEDAIVWLIGEYTADRIPDYQMAAMAMAILFNGLDPDELAAWTEAMLRSGDTLDFSQLPAPKVDKHSTGGVGDKISIPLTPLVASCGVAIPMISGRGLGHTGGTLDKLESIPGFTTALDKQRIGEILTRHGLVLAGQSETMVPADQRLYALRDATATVPSIPLIASSIMSKKLAEGLDALVLDVKTGSGAFMTDLERARELARTMVGIGGSHGVRTVALVTSMDQPLGAEVGNANEIRESLEVLRGKGPEDVTELTLVIGELMLELAGIEGGRERLLGAIDDGSAIAKLADVTAAHGGDASVIHDPDLLPVAAHQGVVTANSSGWVTACDAHAVGMAATRLGAGRDRREDEVDPGVGITLLAKVGDRVEEGAPLARVRYSEEQRWQDQRQNLASAWAIGPERVEPPRLVIDRIEGPTVSIAAPPQ